MSLDFDSGLSVLPQCFITQRQRAGNISLFFVISLFVFERQTANALCFHSGAHSFEWVVKSFTCCVSLTSFPDPQADPRSTSLKSTPKNVLTYIRRWIRYIYKTRGSFSGVFCFREWFSLWWKVSAVPAPSARGQSSTHIKAPEHHRHFCRSSFSPLRQWCRLWPSIRRHFKQVANGAYLCMNSC